jgi:RND family efflux transporter MFP subunit
MRTWARRLIAVPALLIIGGAAGIWAQERYHVMSRLGLTAESAGAEHDGNEPAASHKSTADEADAGDEGEPAIEAVPTVRTARAEVGEITQARDVFGSVVPKPGAVVASALNCEVIVKKALVIAGQLVAKDDALCEVQASPATLAELDAANAEIESAGKVLQAVRDRQSANLGTRQELLEAENAERQARLKLAQLQATLPDRSGIVRAGAAGRVMEMHVQSGAIVPAGTTLVEILEGDAVMIELGVLPDDAAGLVAGQTMPLEIPARGGETKLTGSIAWVSGSVDAASHMVDAYLAAPREAALRVGEIVRGRIERKSSDHIIVPRVAVLPGEDGQTIFVVQDGRARRRIVTTGLQDSSRVELTGGEVKAGDEVVILGNYELEDGMEVHVGPALAAPGKPETRQ